MTASSVQAPATTGLTKIALATAIGTTVEWYDFFIYGAVAGIVFNHAFFGGLGAGLATVIAFASMAISFLFRPLGAFLAGHYGDKLGRRFILVVTLLGMGGATFLIGVLPTSASIGFWAPVLLVLLRVLQGLSAGGEWGGAVLMAVEHAPRGKRGLFGAMPQIGVPLALLLSSATLAIISWALSDNAFYQWGWRIPFLLSFILILAGYWIRRNLDDTPVFNEIAERGAQEKTPLKTLFREHRLLIILAALVFAGNNAFGYMSTGGFIQSYATDPNGSVLLSKDVVFAAVSVSGASWLAFTLLAGWVSDYIGRKSVYIIGWILQALAILVLFPLVNTGSGIAFTAGLVISTAGLGFTYGAQSSWYAELFPANVRFSGVSVSYAIGALIGGAFAPMIAQIIYQSSAGSVGISVYLMGMTIIGLIATLMLRNRNDIDLSLDNLEAQKTGALVVGQAKPQARRLA